MISVVIPVYNNQSTLIELYSQLRYELTLAKSSFEVIFINDFSTDCSLSVIESLIQQYKNVSCLNNKKNIGQNLSLLRGIKAARGNSIIVMDADLQDSPRYLRELLVSLNSGNEAVFLLRNGQYQAISRMFTSRVLKGVVQYITGLNMKAGTYFVMTSSLAHRLLDQQIKYPIITIMVYTLSISTKYIEGHRNHNQGVTSYSTLKRVKYGMRAIYCAIQCKRLQTKLN